MRKKKHLIAISKIAKLLSFAMAFLAVFLVAAFSNSNKANAQSEQVGVDFFMVKITSETIPNNDDAFTISSLPKFKAVAKDDVLAWTCPESGTCIVLYQDNLNTCLNYAGGAFVNDVSINNPTNATILNGVASGISYYYTASEIPTSGSAAPGTYVYGVESTNYGTLTLYNNTNTSGQWYKSDTKDGTYSLCSNGETLVLAKNDTTAVGWYKFENTDPINVLFFNRNNGIFSNGMVYSDANGSGETAHDWLIGNNKNATYYNISQTRLKYYSFNVYGSYDVPDDSNANDKFRGKTVIFASSSEEMWNTVSLAESNPAQATNEDIIGTYYNSQKLSLFSAYPSEKGVVFNATLGDAQKSFLIESTMKLGHTNTYKHLFDSYNANNTNITLELKDDTSLDYCYSIAAPADATTEQKKASTAFKFASNPTYMSIGKYTDTKCWANTHADSSTDTQKIGTYNNDANVVVDSYGIDRAMIASWTNCQPGDVISFEISLGKADDILDFPSAPAHDHNLSYTASGATITATCSAEGCSLTNKQATLTLVAPTELAYDGTAKVATFENGYNKDVFANPVIKYYKGTEEVTSCINAGTYVAKVTYGEATAQVSFTITTISMADYTLALSANTLTYSGVEQTVVPTVRLGDGPILTEGTDYTVSGNVATNVGEYTVTVTGKDNFEGELTATFNIVAANIRGVSVNAPEGGFDDNYFYVVTTWEKTGIFAWTGNGAYFGEWPGTEMTAVGNGMFKIAYPEFKSGDTTIYFIFNDATGERVGHQTADLKYSKHAALSSLYYVDANCAVTFDPRYQNCAEITLLRNSADIDSVVFAELNLVEGTDYTVVYKSLTGTTIDKPVLPGSYIISITGKGNFEGTVTKEFTLVHEHDLSCTASGDTITATCSAIGCPLTEGTATLTIKAPTSLVYDGNAKSASLSQYDATVFNPGAIKYYKGDEEVAAEDVKNAGTYVAKVTSNELTIEVAFEIIVASLDGYTLTLSADTLTYNAEEQTVITTVRKTDGPILTEDKDYTVAGNKGTNAGEYTVTVTAKGNYAGTLTATFTIEPANIQGTSVDAPEGGFDDNYFYVVTPWAKTNIYAWTDASGEYFGNWPGTEMTSVGNGMFKIAYPALKGNDTSIKFIFNNNTGSKQTSDLGYSKTEALGSVYYVTDVGATTYTTTYKPRYQNSVVITVSEDTGNVESITFGTNVLVLDVDYTITYKDSTGNPITKPTVAGNYTSVITGIGNYTGTVEKALTITHIHNFTYVANGNKITASCGADCPITTGLEVIMEAPANLVYDGNAKKIGFTTGYNSEVFQGLVIKYYKGTEEVECKNAGTYVCKATIGGVTAQLEFTIAKAESNPVAQDYDTYYGKKLSEIILDEGWTWDTPDEYVGNVGDHYYSATYTPEDTENYKTKTMELLVTVVIAIPEYTVPTGLKVLINKTLADVTLPAGFSWKNATQNVGDEVGEKTFKATYTPEDTENYEIVENIDVTVLVYDHEHNLSYTASGATITATCSAEGCPLDNKQATLTLVAPANLVYDGTAKTATFADGYDQNVFASPVIKYYKGTEEVTSCINAGDYVAKVTYGDATAQVSFTITKAESNPVAQDYDTYYGKKLSEIILDEGWAWDNPNEYVGNVGDHYYSATYTPEDTENYKTKTMELLVTVVIAIPDYTLPTGLKVLINKTLAGVTLPAGFSWKNAAQNVGEEVGEKTFKATYTPEDTENYEIVENIDVTVLVYAHEHSFTYKANGSKITAKCNNEACYITEGLELKLLAPTGNMVYDGNARVATLEEGYDEEAFPTPVIKYYKGTQEVTSCVDVGNYVAKVTYGNATAQVSFTIETWNIKDPKGVEATIEGAPYTDNITIVVEVKTSLSEQQVQADYDKIKNKLEANEDISKVYEVKLIRTVDGVSTEIQPADIKPGTEITIVMTLPEEVIKAGSFRILHIHSADDVEFITNFVVNGKTVSFKVSRLSEFAFILKSTPENHGFCIGWVLFIIMILQIMYLCFFCLLPVFNKKGKLVGKMDLFKLIGIGTAIAALFFAVIVLAVHACTIAVVSSILSAFICIAYIVIMIIGMVRIPAND